MGEKLPWGKRKQRELPFVCTTAQARRQQQERPVPSQVGIPGGGVSINIAAHLGSNELHRFSLHIINLWNIIPFTSNTPHSDSQLRRLGPAGEGTYYHVTSSEGRFP